MKRKFYPLFFFPTVLIHRCVAQFLQQLTVKYCNYYNPVVM